METKFNINEVEANTGISAFTIRYYDKCGFLPDLGRDSRGRRFFIQKDLDQLQLIEALRKSGLSIDGIKYFIQLELHDENLEGIQNILVQQIERIEMQQDELTKCLLVLQNTLDSTKKAV